jgi:hypothetical protein
VPSEFFIQTLEETDLVLLDWPANDRLVDEIPGFAAAFSVGLQKLSVAREQRIIASMSETAAQRYQRFVEKYPSITSACRKHMIASYLGMTAGDTEPRAPRARDEAKERGEAEAFAAPVITAGRPASLPPCVPS